MWPITIEIRDIETGQVWAATGWHAVVVLLAFSVIVLALLWVTYHLVRELLNRDLP